MIKRGIELFDFQMDAKNYLLDKTTDDNSKHKIILKSPTGSGKTIMLLSYIDDYLTNIDKNMIFVWLTPGQGELEKQSQAKMEKIIPNAKTGDINDILLQGFIDGTTYFINWEMVTSKKNNALKESERKNLFERIVDAHRNEYEFIVIIDEEHLNNTAKANDVLHALNSKYEIRVSATTKYIASAEFYEIPEEEVINSGLITRALYINPDIEIDEIDDLDTETLFLIQKADAKRKEIKQAYVEHEENINPLVIIQFPNTSEKLIEYVEENLENMGYSYDNGLLGKWLSDEKHHIENITDNDNPVNFLLMKQAISTGWDCPRAKVLIKLRENMTETFEIQTLGRIRRMPKAKHYEDERLDHCFLYTFDEKYKEAAIQSGNAYEVRRLFLKEKCKEFELIKEVRNKDFDYVNEKEVLEKAYSYFKEKYKLVDNFEENKKILESHDFKFGTKIHSQYRNGAFRRLKDIADHSKGSFKEISYEVNTHQHGIDCLHSIDMSKKVIGLPSKKMRAVLQHLFHQMIKSKHKLLSLSNREWYAFLINNAYLLRDTFSDASASPNNIQLQFLDKKKIKYRLPLQDFQKYLPYETDVEIYENNAYEEYDTSMTSSEFRSTSEQLFEYFLEEKDDIEWFFKNGDTGQQYLSIVYRTSFNKEYLFYPDYILKKNNGEIWIIETKGGEFQGKSKNIDKQTHNKFNAFKEYAKEHKINWGFVRDKNNKLYLNNTVYTENMNDSVWQKLENLL